MNITFTKMRRSNKYTNILLLLSMSILFTTKVVSSVSSSNSEIKSHYASQNTTHNIEIIGSGCVNLLLFDKMEKESLIYNGLVPAIKIIFRENANLGLGIEYSLFFAKKSTLVSNINFDEAIQGEYFVQPIILSFNYKINNFNLFFGLGISNIESTLKSSSEIIAQNYNNSAVYNYGIDYSLKLHEKFYFGFVSKGFYHNAIDKFNIQTGIFIKYNFTF